MSNTEIDYENTDKQEMTDTFSFRPRVLVVDDEDRIQKACHRLLTREGCEVALAGNGIKGLKMIEEAHFDIVLLDLMMPGMSGMDVLAGIKARHPDTVIIVITGYATLEHSIETMKQGAFDFLSNGDNHCRAIETFCYGNRTFHRIGDISASVSIYEWATDVTHHR